MRNLQAKTEMIVHIILSIRFDGQIVTDWTHVISMILKNGGTSNKTINKLNEFGISVSSSQLVTVNLPTAAKTWFDGQFRKFMTNARSGNYSVTYISDNFAYNKWAREMLFGTTFSSSLNSLTTIFVAFLASNLSPIPSQL